ncbi:MAG: hypothetical protein P8123_03660 [bacterium]
MNKPLWCVIVCIITLASVGSSARAQSAKEAKGPKFLSAAAKKIAGKNKEATAEYQKALDVIKEGNAAKAKGDSATAYCLYGEAVYRLNHIAEKWPEWNKGVVAKQLKNITDVSDKLAAVTCKNLEKMKEAQFRLEVWKRQALILNKLDKLEQRFDEVDSEYWNKWDKYLKDIWQTMLDRR